MSISSLPEQALRSFEALSQLNVCVHDLCGNLSPLIDATRSWHGSKFCRAIKNGPHFDKCFAFDQTQIRDKLDTLIKTNGHVKTCHAGLSEWVVPVQYNGRALAILFAGQRRSKNWKADIIDKASGVPTPQAPFVTIEMSGHYLESLRQLAARLSNFLQEIKPNTDLPASRSHRIQEFIDKHHHQALRLSDLAKHLHISPSRAAHAVREECHKSWSELLCSARLRTACNLLQHSDHNLIQIAMISGFGDQSQFHKIFKRYFLVSPSQYRKDPENK